jgi:hypothetical protein
LDNSTYQAAIATAVFYGGGDPGPRAFEDETKLIKTKNKGWLIVEGRFVPTY